MRSFPSGTMSILAGDSVVLYLVRFIPNGGDSWSEVDWVYGRSSFTVYNWPGGTKVFSSGSIAKNGLGTIRHSVDVREGGNVAKLSRLSIKLVNSPAVDLGSRLDATWGTWELEGRRVEIWIHGGTGDNGYYANVRMIYAGVMDDIHWDYDFFYIDVKSADDHRHRKIPAYSITKENWPKCPDGNIGANVPLIYGGQDLLSGQASHNNRRLLPMLKADEEKEIYLVSANKSNTPGSFLYLHVYFDGPNLMGSFKPKSGAWTVTEARPTKLEFPLGVEFEGLVFSQGKRQGSKTSPTSLDYGNAVDDSDISAFTLGSSQMLYLYFPMISEGEFGAIADESAVQLRVKCKNLTGSGGYLKYYNPAWDGGVGGWATGVSFSSISSGYLYYTFGTDKTAHGRDDNQSDQNDPWLFDEIGECEFGIQMNSGATIAIENIYLQIGNITVRGVVVQKLLRGKARRRRGLTPGKSEKVETISDRLVLHQVGWGELSGTWIVRSGNGQASGQYINGLYNIELLLRSELELTNPEIDVDSFDEIGNTTNGHRKDWRVCKMVEDKADSREIIAEVCKQTGIVYFQNYENKEAVSALKKKASVLTIDRSTLRRGSADVEISQSPVSDIYNQFTVYYFVMNDGSLARTKYVTEDGNNLTTNARAGTPNTYSGLCAASRTRYGTNRHWIVEADWIRDDATAELLLKWFAEWMCYRRFEAVIHNAGLDHLPLELGDQIKINHTLLPTGVSNVSCFAVIDAAHNLAKDTLKFETVQIPDLLP